jgi:YggT family protein
MSVIQQILLFLVETLFSLYISAIIIRFLLGYAKADFYNPLSQFLVKITNPLLVPLRRFVPALGKLDTAAIVAAYVLTVIKSIIIFALIGKGLSLFGILAFSLKELLVGVIWIYIIALILMAVISWIGSSHGNPVSPLVNSLVSPLVNPVRRKLPPVGMFDLSPMVVMLGLYILLIIVNGIL